MGFQHNLYIKPSKKDKQIPSYLYGQGGDINLKDWIQEAIDRGYITVSGGSGGAIPNPLTAPITIDLAGHDLIFDGETTPGGHFTFKTELSNGSVAQVLSTSDFSGTGAQLLGSATLTPAQYGSFSFFGDISPMGFTVSDIGAVFGTVDFAGGSASATLITEIDDISKDATLNSTAMSTLAGTATSNLVAINQGTGNALNNVVSSIADAGATAESNVLALSIVSGGSTQASLTARNDTDGVLNTLMVSETGVSLIDNVTIRFTIPADIGATTYADDTAAGVGGLVAGQWYLRTTGEIAQKL